MCHANVPRGRCVLDDALPTTGTSLGDPTVHNPLESPDWTDVKHRYRLTVDAAEKAALGRMLHSCL